MMMSIVWNKTLLQLLCRHKENYNILALSMKILDQVLKQVHSFFNLDFIDFQQVLLNSNSQKKGIITTTVFLKYFFLVIFQQA